MRIFLFALLVFLISPVAMRWTHKPMFACTGSSPNLSAPDTGNAATNGTNFSACLSSAVLGDTITVTKGATYQGNFTLSNKGAGTSYITIQSTGIGNLTADVRVTSANQAELALFTTATGDPVLTFAADSHHWKFQGVAVTTANTYPSSQRTAVLIASADNITYSHWPHHITFDRYRVYAAESDPLPYRSAECGFEIEGANITITNGSAENFMGWEYPSVRNTITAATNASPVQVTFSGPWDGVAGADPGHKFLVYLDGATGNWTPLNGPKVKVATWVDATHATLQSYDESSWALTNINSTSFGSFSGQSISQMTTAIATSRAFLMISGPGPYTITNNNGEAYYTAMFTGGGSFTWIDPNNDATVTAVNSLTQVVLNKVGNLAIGDLISFDTTQDQSISGATAGSPTSLTVPTTTYPTGTHLTPEGCITVSGFTGTWAPLNGSWGSSGNGCGTGVANVVDSTHISIPVDSTGFGPVTSSSPKWVLTTKNNSGSTQWVVGKVTNVSGLTVTYTWWGHQPQNIDGNGAGILVANGARALFNGLDLDTLTVERNTFGPKRDWIWLIRDVAKSCDNCSGQPPKATWEAKIGDNVLVNGNTFEINGGDLSPNSGTVCIGINQANQNGATPWVSVNNWTITNNLFKHYTYQKSSLKEEYESGEVSTNLLFSNNLLTNTNASFFNFEGGDGMTVTHNTVRNNGTGSGSGGGYNGFIVALSVNTNSVVKDNIGNWVLYGYLDFSPLGDWAPTRNHNYLIDNLSQSFTPPTGDVKVVNDAAMGFTNVTSADAGGDYHGYKLTSGSVGHLAASDNKDVGVDFDLLDAALSGSTPPSTPTTTLRKVTVGGHVVIR